MISMYEAYFGTVLEFINDSFHSVANSTAWITTATYYDYACATLQRIKDINCLLRNVAFCSCNSSWSLTENSPNHFVDKI